MCVALNVLKLLMRAKMHCQSTLALHCVCVCVLAHFHMSQAIGRSGNEKYFIHSSSTKNAGLPGPWVKASPGGGGELAIEGSVWTFDLGQSVSIDRSGKRVMGGTPAVWLVGGI